MRTNYVINSGTRFRMLSDDQLQELYDGVLHVLEHTGLEVQHEAARKILKDLGAWVDGSRVRVPAYLVKRALDTAPRSFTLFARDGNAAHDIHVSPGRAHFGPGADCPNFVDTDSMQRRPYVQADAALVAKVADALPNIDFCQSLGRASDVNPKLAALHEFAGLFANTSKPVIAWAYGKSDLEGIHQIAIAEAGGQETFERRPNYALGCEMQAPLVITSEVFETLMFAAQKRVPFILAARPVAGSCAPATTAGLITQGAAEAWLALVIAQDVKPGLPFFMGGVFSALDTTGGIAPYSGPELSLAMTGLTELAHFAGLPAWTTGGASETKTYDEQGMIEGSMSAFFSALSGGDLTHAVGVIENGLTGSIFQLAAMDEAIGYARRITRGIEVNEDTLAVEAIHAVGPNGHYLKQPHTRRYYKTEFWSPNLCDRTDFETWAMAGSTTMKDRLIARVQDILSSHQPTPIKAETGKAIEKALQEAEKRVK